MLQINARNLQAIVEAGRMEIEAIPFALEALVRDTLGPLRLRAEQAGLSLELVFDPRLPEGLLGAPDRIRQVLVNLVANAIKFTPSGRVTVRVIHCDGPPPAPTVRIEVEDTGIGIDPDRIDALLQPFVQADSSTSRRFGGTGLGLTICHSLVTLMGGLEATGRIRSREAQSGTTPAMPIIALTAHALPEARRDCLDAGMNDVLLRPVDLDCLRSTLVRWLPER